jgi:hypothetical protein
VLLVVAIATFALLVIGVKPTGQFPCARAATREFLKDHALIIGGI